MDETGKYPRPRDMDHLIRILSSFTNYEKNRDFHKGKVRFDLANMTRLLGAAEDPHLKVPCIHIAGSKGKGSTAIMTSAILSSLGVSTGLFTSPHLDRINERIAVNGVPLKDDKMLEAADAVLSILRKDRELKPTFFEFITACAMMAFHAAGVDAAVYEAGLGGRLDCTNVVLPEVSVITTVEKEHCAVLGESLEEIAGEKAGIIKERVPVITALEEGGGARKEIEIKAAKLNASLLAPGCGLETTVEKGGFFVTAGSVRHGPFLPPPPATLQGPNLACAVAAAAIFAKRLGRKWDECAVLNSVNRLKLPCRFEVCRNDPMVIVDGAHTMRSISASLDEAGSYGLGRPVLVLGLAEDKDARGILDRALASSREMIFTSYEGGRALDPALLKSMAQDRGIVARSPSKALSLAEKKAGAGGVVLVVGSFYLAGEARKLCLNG